MEKRERRSALKDSLATVGIRLPQNIPLDLKELGSQSPHCCIMGKLKDAVEGPGKKHNKVFFTIAAH